MSESAQVIDGEVVMIDQQTAMVRSASPGDVVAAVEDYRKVQKALDDAMPDCLITIQQRKFRKKNYWRAVATAFNLTVTLKAEEQTTEGGDPVWLVVYNASASNGRSADGDGSCAMSEKRGAMATIHNVRAHAHTRAYNRAVSNLVGFGEVSAEEMMQEQRPEPPTAGTPDSALRPPRAAPQQSGGRTISEKQQKRLFAICQSTAERLEVPVDQVRARMREHLANLGMESTSDLTREPYETMCNTIESMALNDLVPPAKEEGREGGPL